MTPLPTLKALLPKESEGENLVQSWRYEPSQVDAIFFLFC